MYPVIGRIVHYSLDVDSGDGIPETFAAIITEVIGLPDPHNHKHECNEACASVTLTIFLPTGIRTEFDIPFSPKAKRRHWNWPPKE